MGSFSGSAQTNLLTALRFLGLITETGAPTELLADLVNTPEDGRRGVAERMLENAYSFVFSNSFDLATSTPKHLNDVFSNAGAKGGSLRKCVKFFVSLSEYAGLTVSEYIKAGAKRGPKPGGAGKSRKDNAKNRDASSQEKGSAAIQKPVSTDWQKVMIEKILEKTVAFDPTWPPEAQVVYWEFMKQMLADVKDNK